jgi:hypothetical protein
MDEVPTNGVGSSGSYRALAAIGGALGVLPLLDTARDLATDLFQIPDLAGAERLLRDVKQATYFEIAVLLLLAPASALFFGRVLPALLRARGVVSRRAELAGAAFGVSFLIWRTGASDKVSVVVGLALATTVIAAPALGRSRIVAPLALLAIFVAGLIAYYRPAKRLDLFEDGMILFGASSLADGARPYLDVYPVHGWGADGGLDAIVFRHVEHDLHAFQVIRAVMTALALTCLAAASLLFFNDLVWGAFGYLACLGFCPFVSERHIPGLLAYCLLIRASRDHRINDWIWAGVVSAVTLFETLDFGIIFVVAGAVGPVALRILRRESPVRALPAVLRFGGGLLLGAAPFVAILAARGSLGEFVSVSFREIPRMVSPAWNFPAVSFDKAMREGSILACLGRSDAEIAPSLCVLLFSLGAALVLLLLRSSDRVLDGPDRAAVIGLIVAVVALRGVLGRADLGHRMIYSVFAGLPAAWLLYRAWKTAMRFRSVVFAITAIAFVLLLRPDQALSRQITAVTAAPYVRRIDAAAGTRVPGYGPAMLARDQAADVEKLRRFVDEVVPAGETFFEFGNEPGLYFLLDRRPPVRYSHVPSYQTDEKQHEVIAALERERPPLAILSSGTPTDIFDSVSNRDRAPLVARFLDAHYRVVGKVGQRTLGVWKDP